ncbi:MAG TPA: hypothetical protein VJ970_03180 [Flavobacteriaceae bacterium]|nr:hypothetical protein [Flavobacteriaceae bacterium]
MKTSKTNTRSNVLSILDLNSLTKRNTWNNRRRYSSSAQFKFI